MLLSFYWKFTTTFKPFILLLQQASFDVVVTAQSCTDELMAGRNMTVRIPGFGQFVIELTGVCGCNCTSFPVSIYSISFTAF